jgi:hypothetical protein
MPIHQINLFVCEKCGQKDTSCYEVILYDDPVVSKEGWGYGNGEAQELLLCPTCRQSVKFDTES